MPLSTGRRRLVLAVALAVAVIAVAGWSWRQQDPQPTGTAVAGPSGTSTAGSEPDCGRVLREPAGGAGAHIDDAPITYSSAPPSFGDHSSRWEVLAQNFYDVDDRPDVAVLVHNLEHGYNILWYDETVLDDSEALARVQSIADGYATSLRRDPGTAFIAAPWTSADGASFPDGMHYALTHWYADPTDRTRSRDDELGLTRYCADITAEVVQDWMTDYPLRDAPEGYPDLM